MLRTRDLIRQALALVLLVAISLPAAAHQLRPALAEITFFEQGQKWLIVFSQMNLEALIADIGPDHDNTDDSIKRPLYESYREMSATELRVAFDVYAPDFLAGIDMRIGEDRLSPFVDSVIIPETGDLDIARDSIVNLSGSIPPGSEAVTFAWNPRFGDVVLRTTATDDGEGYSAFLTGGDRSAEIPVTGAVSTSAWAAFLQYVVVGFEHILPLGLDHILFVIGLFLFSTQMRPLLVQVTSFTVAHTLTLALGVLGIVTIPGEIVEPLIALSITYVAVENVLTDKLTKFRPALVVFFGLLHGLGFAGVLQEFGLAPGQFLTSLIAFNIGVELGQLTVIAVCMLAVGVWFGGKSWYRRVVVIPGSLAVGGYGLAWFLERALDMPLGYIGLAVLIALVGIFLMSAKGWSGRFIANTGMITGGVALALVLRTVEASLA